MIARLFSSLARLMPRLLMAGMLALPAAVLAAPRLSAAADEPITLRIHHFLGAKAPIHNAFLLPWTERIEQQSNGRLAFKIYPSMALGGRPTDLYQQVQEGRVDIAWTVAGYTPERFPRVEVFELPFVHTNDIIATNVAIADIFDDHLAADLTDVHTLMVHVHAGQMFQMAGQPIRSLDDVAGKRIRAPTRIGLWMLEAWGAEPMGVPLPAVPLALQKDVIDGMMLPFEVIRPFKLQTLTSSITHGHDDTRFGTAVFLLVMNKQVYESLPADLKTVLDRNSGRNLAEPAGRIWRDAEGPGLEATLEKGNEIVTLPPSEMARFERSSTQITDRWLAEVASRGIDGEALLRAARQAIADYRP